MTVSEYIFDFLQKKGLTTVYMVSGSSAMWLTDALYQNKNLKAICCHHEQVAAMAADGYGRVNTVPGACLVTIGPGATNAITGVAQAYLDSSPMFVISGQANSKLVANQREKGVRQIGTQALDLEPIVSSITKYFHIVMEPDEIISVMNKAYSMATFGRKGPVWIDIPVDIQNRDVSETILNEVDKAGVQARDSFTIEDKKSNKQPNYKKIVQAIRSTKKPLIMAGAGIKAACAADELRQLCELLCIPVITSRGGIDVVSSKSIWFVGRPGAYGDRPSHFAVAQCDYLLILGSRLSVSTVGYYPNRFGEHAYKIMVDIDSLELAREDVPVNEKYCMDVKVFMQELLKSANADRIIENTWKNIHYKWGEYLHSLKNKYPTVLSQYKNENPLNEYYVTERLSTYAPQNTNIIVDTGSVCNVVSQSWQIKEGQNYLISGGLSCMGFWATAIGAYQKEKALIAITGDGSAQMNIQELATLKTTKIPLKLFIYHNQGYMLIRHNQHNYMQDRFLGVGPDSGVETPDFIKVAQAYGVKAYQIDTAEELDLIIPKVLEEKEPVVCQVIVQEFAPIIPRIASKVMSDGSLKAAEFDDLYPFLSEEEYKLSLY